MQPAADIPVQTAIIQSESKEDRINDIKTLYNVSSFQIIWRNFLAGFARALGGIFLYLLFLFVISYFTYLYILPKLMPTINNYIRMMQSLSNQGRPVDNANSNNPLLNDPLVQQLIEKYQK